MKTAKNVNSVTYELRCPDCRKYIPALQSGSIPVHKLVTGDECSGSGKPATGINVKVESISFELKGGNE